jgi:dCMP deaminase
MTDTRPPWDTYFLAMAKVVATRADCRRAKHGAVIVKEHRVVSTGYNGSPPGGVSCLDGGCPRGLLTNEELGHNHADYTNCVALHAEQNAIAYADHHDTVGATIYITGAPCDMCTKLIKAAGITELVYEPWAARRRVG